MRALRSQIAITPALSSALVGAAHLWSTTAAQADPGFSVYGTPGLIEMPTAEVMDDGQLAFTFSQFADTSKTTLFFQFLPYVYGAFRYSVIDNFVGGTSANYDRSFDLHIQLAEERGLRPAIAVGLRDFLGTGIYSSEYLVATKSITPNFSATAGIGWGRLGSRNEFSNPLGVLADRFDTRPPIDVGQGGEVNTNVWFRGDAAFFGGLNWNVTDQLSLALEYSSDNYETERARGAGTLDSPINFGAKYRFQSGWSLAGYVNGGETFGAQLSFDLNPKRPNFNAGAEGEGPALAPRLPLAATSWNIPLGKRAPGQEMDLETALRAQGIQLDGVRQEGDTVFLEIENRQWLKQAQTVGRAARVLARMTPETVRTFVIILRKKGVPITSVNLKRRDLYELENDLDGAWRSYTRAVIEDAPAGPALAPIPAGRQFEYSFSPYFRFSFFDPDEPLRYEFGPQLNLSYRPIEGLTFSTNLRYPLYSTIDDATRTSDSVLPRVRTDTVLYSQQSDFEINTLTAEYLFRPSEDLFGRVTAGYLETMYAGLSGELLWAPTASRLALGVELNYARKRDFDGLLGLQSYDVVTGHASAYYDFGNDFYGQVDAGRYLAGDWGATFTLKREFNSGIRVGGFFTLTDVPFSEFGEGSFDKGITFEIPLSWVTGQPSANRFGTTIRPITRDGGARLDVSTRLYEFIRDSRAEELKDGWGRFYR
ncbi:Exopolysaccharide biosynthesis protein YbjH [Roseovarius litoreus]|uniref:Exopolysaccharide biosynthesis protein YbjH n=1 Tax=Roseovarius litoreus TaxID=1155722 RepID=A0A1M7KVR9_9RHOB|nr:YjbH domain-containing protein [Roseovarius litoreus]SHM69616.1 Exopolysaccharide biosynthesis protein YbjH [Roseovarius litoreus]